MQKEAYDPVPGLPGVLTCPTLRNFPLGIAPDYRLLVCLACRPARVVNFPTAAKHVTSHKPEQRGLTKAKVLGACKQFNLFQEQVRVSSFGEDRI
jgi:hypothetical protein